MDLVMAYNLKSMHYDFPDNPIKCLTTVLILKNSLLKLNKDIIVLLLRVKIFALKS